MRTKVKSYKKRSGGTVVAHTRTGGANETNLNKPNLNLSQTAPQVGAGPGGENIASASRVCQGCGISLDEFPDYVHGCCFNCEQQGAIEDPGGQINRMKQMDDRDMLTVASTNRYLHHQPNPSVITAGVSQYVGIFNDHSKNN